MRPRLANYVARYCLLGPVGQLPNDLIADEYYARRHYGDRPTHAEYLDVFGVRHPDWRNSFRRWTREWLPRNIFPRILFPKRVRRSATCCDVAWQRCRRMRGLGQSPDFAADSPLQCAARPVTLGELFQRARPRHWDS